MNNSVWAETKLPDFPKLKTNLKTDVLIIGGGLAGILCAHFLSEAGVSYALVEADRICHGVTRNTTAKITSQHGLIYDKLINEFGVEKAEMYFKANEVAIDKYRKLCKDIPCDFEEKSAFLYSTEKNDKLEYEAEALRKIGAKFEVLNSLPLPFDIHSAIKFENQAQFNPLKFVSAIAKGLNIYESTKVISFIGNCFYTDNGCKITAKKTLVATHFPFLNKHGSYFLKMYQHRSYVLTLENAQNVEGMYIDQNKKGLSFRNYGDLLLLGGGAHRTGKRGGSFSELQNTAKKHYPNSKEKYRFATQDCMTLDGVPYIGIYSKNTPNLYVATGFNKWGMTSSMVAAEVLRDLITERNNDFATVFSPSRSIIRPQLFVNATYTTLNLITPTTPRCPHLGCALKWNKQEQSWDCPCHGSRFSDKGKLLDNPATGDMKKD